MSKCETSCGSKTWPRNSCGISILIPPSPAFRRLTTHLHLDSVRETPLEETLPVDMGTRDDRVNFPQPTQLARDYGIAEHAVLSNLPWDEQPPSIGGLNRVEAKLGTETALFAVPHKVYVQNAEFIFEAKKPYPALVLGQHGQGRTATFMSDVAPHWVGGFVDWGPERVKAQAPGASAIEVGSHYAQFWKQLLSWVGRLE